MAGTYCWEISVKNAALYSNVVGTDMRKYFAALLEQTSDNIWLHCRNRLKGSVQRESSINDRYFQRGLVGATQGGRAQPDFSLAWLEAA
jgi:hypothetical protein